MNHPLRGSLAPLGVASGVAPGNGLLNGLVAYWGLDEAAGANDALDKHTGGLHLTQVSSPGSAAGKVYAGARTFDGAADYFTDANNAALTVGNFDWRLAAWVYRTGNGTIVTQDANNNRNFEVLIQAGIVYFYIFMTNASYIAPPVVLPASTWGLVECWLDTTAKTVNVALNGSAPTTYSYGALTPNASSAKWQIGAREIAVSERFAGRIGPVAFWKNRTLDATARAALWANGNGLPYSEFT